MRRVLRLHEDGGVEVGCGRIALLHVGDSRLRHEISLHRALSLHLSQTARWKVKNIFHCSALPTLCTVPIRRVAVWRGQRNALDYAPTTRHYTHTASEFAKYFHKSPHQLGLRRRLGGHFSRLGQ